MSVAAALSAAAARLAAAGVEGPARDVRLLMAEALGVPADRVTPSAGDPLPPEAEALFERMVAQRAERRPVAQILGRRQFWGRDFAVTGDVLDPRPETETLVAAALAGAPAARVLDLGTGSGAILLTLLAEWPEAEGTGTDASPAALALVASSAAALGVAGRLRLVEADWTAGLDGAFDLVTCNPPYIPAAEVETLAPEVRLWEPLGALTAGPSGLEAYRRLAGEIARVMAPGARALLEHGAGQAEAVAAIFRQAGYAVAGHHRDMDGRPRVIEIARG